MTTPKTLRAYQSRIVAVAETSNTVVVLPTGAGKTLVAAELIRRRGGKSLFLVPTCMLVEQQAGQLRAWTGQLVGEYMSGNGFPSQFDILVSTPKALETAMLRSIAPCWSSYKTVVFDEVHHVLKDHPYRKLAVKLRLEHPLPNEIRVLGLTASVTYAVEASKVETSMRRLCDDLQVQKMETANAIELRASGYHAFGTQAEVLTGEDIDLPGTPFETGLLDRVARKPHLMVQSFFSRVNKFTATTYACDLVRCVHSLESSVLSVDATFRSPLKGSVSSWGEYAHKKRLCSSLYGFVEHWYEALRLLVVSWEEAFDASICFLLMTNSLDDGKWPHLVDSQIRVFRRTYAEKHMPRLDHLKDVLTYKLESTSSTFRGILFVQQRVMTHILKYIIQNDQALSAKLNMVTLYAHASPATPSFRLTKADVQRNLKQFASGEANLLISTVVAEEGMDIPAANCVIRFDPVLNTVSFNQGRGRARQQGSSFVIMSEQAGRSAETLARAEQQQLSIAQNFQPTKRDAGTIEREVSAQKDRERSARSMLCSEVVVSPIATLHLYCKKTKVDLQEQIFKDKGVWVCILKYTSVLRDISTRNTGINKKAAKVCATSALLALLLKTP